MGKAKVITADMFTPGLLIAANKNLNESHNPVTVFKFGDTEFSVTLRRIGGSRVLGKAERLLMERIKNGQDKLSAKETLMARRILARQP